MMIVSGLSVRQRSPNSGVSTKEDGQLDLEKIAIQFAKQPPTYVFMSHVSMMLDPNDIERPVKNLNTIPTAFACRDEYTAPEINLLLSNNIDPFDKLSILADAIMLQLLRVMYASASMSLTGKTAPWVIDVARSNAEMRKLATDSFSENEAAIVDYIYAGYEHFEDVLKDVTSGSKTKEQKHINDASNDSYKLFRKLAKNLGLLIPIKGPNMRLSLNERLVKVLVLTLIGPRQKITLDYFLELLYRHYGMIIDRQIYEKAIKDKIMSPLADYTFMDVNREALVTLLKDCGYAKKIYNMPVTDALQLQRALENLPDCLDEDDIATVDSYMGLIAERIKLARVEAIEIMFKELDIDEKTRCLDDLKKIMDKGLKRSASGKGSLKSPRFTDEELVLLLHCYLKHREEWFTAKSLHVNELCRLYRDLPIHSMEERLSPTFRNPAGIDMQIRSLAKCDPTDTHHQKLNPSLDMLRIWEEYGEHPETLQDQISKIVFKYGINTKDYPALFD